MAWMSSATTVRSGRARVGVGAGCDGVEGDGCVADVVADVDGAGGTDDAADDAGDHSADDAGETELPAEPSCVACPGATAVPA